MPLFCRVFPSVSATALRTRRALSCRHACSPLRPALKSFRSGTNPTVSTTIIGSEPSQTRAAADAAVKDLGWEKPYFLDADHINLKTVARFLDPCNFFTLDVADLIGQPAPPNDVRKFLQQHRELLGEIIIPGIDKPFLVDQKHIEGVANKFLDCRKTRRPQIYRMLLENKGAGRFVPEISMDETDSPQTPVELLLILAMIADEGIPIQTIAPKFTGRFNKGVDYVGDLASVHARVQRRPRRHCLRHSQPTACPEI